ncbi:MAG: hypothetical protein N4A49_03550 [Marinifilaceae bacterium]|jgi:hypothetical protein|nr:hypothetical protein [Marinifilaceae bacterium]
MFWTDSSIQTSFSTEEILIAILIFLGFSIFGLMRMIPKTSRKNSFILNFLKIFSIPFIFAIIAIFTDTHKIAQWYYGEENVVKSSSDHKSEFRISNTNSETVYIWNGKSLKNKEGELIIRFTDNNIYDSESNKILTWSNSKLKTAKAKLLYYIDSGFIYNKQREKLFRIKLGKIYGSDKNIVLKTASPYDIPKAVLVFSVLHYTNKL